MGDASAVQTTTQLLREALRRDGNRLPRALGWASSTSTKSPARPMGRARCVHKSTGAIGTSRRSTTALAQARAPLEEGRSCPRAPRTDGRRDPIGVARRVQLPGRFPTFIGQASERTAPMDDTRLRLLARQIVEGEKALATLKEARTRRQNQGSHPEPVLSLGPALDTLAPELVGTQQAAPLTPEAVPEPLFFLEAPEDPPAPRRKEDPTERLDGPGRTPARGSASSPPSPPVGEGSGATRTWPRSSARRRTSRRIC